MIAFCIWMSCLFESSLIWNSSSILHTLRFLKDNYFVECTQFAFVWYFSHDLIEIMQLGRNTTEVMLCP